MKLFAWTIFAVLAAFCCTIVDSKKSSDGSVRAGKMMMAESGKNRSKSGSKNGKKNSAGKKNKLTKENSSTSPSDHDSSPDLAPRPTFATTTAPMSVASVVPTAATTSASSPLIRNTITPSHISTDVSSPIVTLNPTGFTATFSPLVATIVPTHVDTDDPTLSPRIQQVLQWLVGQGTVQSTCFNNTDSPQFRAAYWIANEDAALLEIPPINDVGELTIAFIQRYIMALFYFACEGASWDFRFRFLSSDSICDWYTVVAFPDGRQIKHGVSCDYNARVTSLTVPGNHLVGTLVTELGLLTDLELLALNDNGLSGRIPKEFSQLIKLSYLALYQNTLVGSLPSWIGEFTALRILMLGNNNLIGSLPMEWSSLTQIQTLGLDDNILTGNLTPIERYSLLEEAYLNNNFFSQDISAFQWSQLSSLLQLDLSTNAMTGNLSSDLVNLPLLKLLDLSNNQIGGSLPEFDGINISALRYFGMHGNHIGGTIPDNIRNLANLTHLDLSANNFDGLISRHIGELRNLQYFFIADNENLSFQVIPSFIGTLTNLHDLSLKGTNRAASIPPNLLLNLNKLVLLELDNNELTGTIPSELGSIFTLSYLILSGNNLSGTVPAQVQLLPNLDIFLVDRNDLTGDLTSMCTQRQRRPELSGADCGGDSPELECDCCYICCGPDGITGDNCDDLVYFGQIDAEWEHSFQRQYYQFNGEDFGEMLATTDQLKAGGT